MYIISNIKIKKKFNQKNDSSEKFYKKFYFNNEFKKKYKFNQYSYYFHLLKCITFCFVNIGAALEDVSTVLIYF